MLQPTQLAVVEFDGADEAWNGFVRAAANSTFCHLAGWRELNGDVLGHECRYLAAIDASGVWHGVLPLVHVRSRIFGDYLVSMPFVNYGGPLGTADAQRVLTAKAVDIARQLRVKMLELRTCYENQSELPTATRKVTVLLPLAASAESMMARFPSKLRSQIRRPLKEGMEVRFGADHCAPFYEVFSRNMRDLGTPVLPQSWFERLATVFGDSVTFAAVYFRGQPVAAGCGFVFGGEFELTWASALREYNKYSPNMMLYWSLMENMIGRGLSVFNFGRCSPESSTHRFKLQWGGETVTLPWQQWSLSGTAALPNPKSSVFQVATRAWSKLPLRFANGLGPVIARSLP